MVSTIAKYLSWLEKHGNLTFIFFSSVSDKIAGFVQNELVRDLLKKCSRMYKFDHPNVLKISRVCLDGGPAPYIIMPFMANGSLVTSRREKI